MPCWIPVRVSATMQKRAHVVKLKVMQCLKPAVLDSWLVMSFHGAKTSSPKHQLLKQANLKSVAKKICKVFHNKLQCHKRHSESGKNTLWIFARLQIAASEYIGDRNVLFCIVCVPIITKKWACSVDFSTHSVRTWHYVFLVFQMLRYISSEELDGPDGGVETSVRDGRSGHQSNPILFAFWK